MILGLRPANERRRYKVTTSLIGWAQNWNPPCNNSVITLASTTTAVLAWFSEFTWYCVGCHETTNSEIEKINALRPEQNSRNYIDDILKCICVKVWNLDFKFICIDIAKYFDTIDQFHKSHNASVPYPTMCYSEQKCLHFCSESCIVWYGTDALWNLWIWSITFIWCFLALFCVYLLFIY